MNKHFSINNFCNAEEIDNILNYYEILETSQEYSSKRAKRKNMDYHDSDISFMRDIIDPKIKNHFPNGFVSAATFTNWVEQVELHTDSWQPQEDKTKKLGYSVLVPLQIEPISATTSTIIFNQYADNKSSLTTEKFEQDEKWNISEHITTAKANIINKTKNTLDKKFYEKYLNHIDYDMIKNFADPTRYEWKVGNAIVWDRMLFHTSETFQPALESKLHMIFLINFH